MTGPLYEAVLRAAEDLRLILREEDLSASGRAMVENSLALLESTITADSRTKAQRIKDAIQRRMG